MWCVRYAPRQARLFYEYLPAAHYFLALERAATLFVLSGKKWESLAWHNGREAERAGPLAVTSGAEQSFQQDTHTSNLT